MYVVKSPLVWSTSQHTSLSIVTLQLGTACERKQCVEPPLTDHCVALVCRIDSYGLVKVADYYRLTEDIVYGSSYNKEKGESGDDEEKAPIRWMAPESIENDMYTESTDVVS